MLATTQKIIEDNYHILKEISDMLCIMFRVPNSDRDEILSLCHIAVVESTPRMRTNNIKEFWSSCCRNKVIIEYVNKKDRLDIAMVQQVTSWEYLAESKLTEILSRVDLTSKEAEIINYLSLGFCRKEIIEKMSISKFRFYQLKDSTFKKVREQYSEQRTDGC